MSASLDFLVNLLDLEPIEVNIFRGIQPNEERQRVFGGQVAAQALIAAGRTVDHGRVHSLHSYFLRPGDPQVPILYEVDRIRDGRSFTTRRVVAIQHGRAIFNMSASFHDLEVGLEHQLPMPDVPDPESLPTLYERLQPWRKELVDWFERPHPIDQRYIGELLWHQKEAGEPYQRLWIRADGAPRRPAAARRHRGLRLGHVALRHHFGPPRGALGRPDLHGRQPRPLHVVPPPLPGGRVAAL
jgi:acyl-CoA thioesterase-2